MSEPVVIEAFDLLEPVAIGPARFCFQYAEQLKALDIAPAQVRMAFESINRGFESGQNIDPHFLGHQYHDPEAGLLIVMGPEQCLALLELARQQPYMPPKRLEKPSVLMPNTTFQQYSARREVADEESRLAKAERDNQRRERTERSIERGAENRWRAALRKQSEQAANSVASLP